MKAVLTTGETVTLPRDCTCINHKTPHWVHMWRSARDWKVAEATKYATKMDAIKAGAGKTVSFSEFIEYEQLKLALSAVSGEIARIYRDAEAEFRQRGIQRLIDEPEDELTDIEKAALQAHYESLYPPAKPDPDEGYVDHQTAVRVRAREAV